MTKRDKRVIDAFITCVKKGEFTVEYAITLIEDSQRYGWLSDAAKEAFYEAIEAWERRQEEKNMPKVEEAAEMPVKEAEEE